MDFLHRLLGFTEQLKKECAFQDSTEVLDLENPPVISDLNPLEQSWNFTDNSEMSPTRMKRLIELWKRVRGSFHSRVATARPPSRWP
jgi:hypothetical protein